MKPVSSNFLLETLLWDKLAVRKTKQKAIIIIKSLNELATVYMQDLFNERRTDDDLSNSFGKLTLPRPRTNYLKRCFS